MSPGDPSDKWQQPEVASHYRSSRFQNRRSEGRDAGLIERLLDRHAPRTRFERVLDVPCGTGRMRSFLASRATRVVGLDRSPAMLAAGDGGGLLGEAHRLPLRTGSFELVLCCRLLHHLDAEGVEQVVQELVRVSSGLVVVSFWSSSGVQGWRRRLGLRRDPEGRRPSPPGHLRATFEACGATVLGQATSLPGWSLQTFLLASVS